MFCSEAKVGRFMRISENVNDICKGNDLILY